MFSSSSSSSSLPTPHSTSTSLNHYFYTEILPHSAKACRERYFTPVLKQNRSKTGWNDRFLSISRSTLTLAIDKNQQLLSQPDSCKYSIYLTSPTLKIHLFNHSIDGVEYSCLSINKDITVAFDSPWERESCMEFLHSMGITGEIRDGRAGKEDQENWNPNLISALAKDELLKAMPQTQNKAKYRIQENRKEKRKAEEDDSQQDRQTMKLKMENVNEDVSVKDQLGLNEQSENGQIEAETTAETVNEDDLEHELEKQKTFNTTMNFTFTSQNSVLSHGGAVNGTTIHVLPSPVVQLAAGDSLINQSYTSNVGNNTTLNGIWDYTHGRTLSGPLNPEADPVLQINQ